MVHRASRDRLAQALRQYASGRITNDDLDDVDVDWRDRGAIAVSQMAWGLYEDTTLHRATGRYYIARQHRRDIARWIAFLYSDEEYIWPEYSFMQIINWPMNVMTFGWWERMKQRRWQQFLEAGDFQVWPFCDQRTLEKVRKHPKLLAGRDRQGSKAHALLQGA
jgi:hypothetical protein